MKKILEVNVDDNGYGGVYAFVLNVLENIGGEYRIDICSFEQFSKKENVQYIEHFGGKVQFCTHCGNPLKKQLGNFSDLFHLMKKEHYDAIHIHSDVSYKLFLYGIAAKMAGMPCILIHSHSTSVDGKYRWIKNFLHYFFRLGLPFVADKYLACSKKAGEWMYLTLIRKKRSYTVMNNGINVKKFHYNSKCRQQIRKELSLGDSFVIGHIGRFSYQKNHSLLIDIFHEIVKSEPDAKLLLIGSYVGDSKYLDETKMKVNKLSLENNVLFLGIRNDVSFLMQAMDCFVLPSRFEGLPIVGIEAQAAGLPCFFSTAITRELKITDLAHFISLDKTAEEWAEEILRMRNTSSRCNYNKIVGVEYDIRNEIGKLRKLYSN